MVRPKATFPGIWSVELQPHILELQPHIGWVGEIKIKATLTPTSVGIRAELGNKYVRIF